VSPGNRGATASAAAEQDPIASSAPERFTPRWLAKRLRALQGPLRGRRWCIAYSGGLDSSVLLTALALLREREGFKLRALHVDHGLHAHSSDWAAAAAARARAWRVPCETIALRLQIARGESLEAVAREARYRALASRLEPGESLLTAHNQDDQLETVLLALLRGSGVRGLAAMSASTALGQTWLLRPLLPVARAQLEQFARARSLQWTEDETNVDERFDRNYLRRRVLPALKERWPAAAATASRSAAHLAEARGLLGRLARISAARAVDGPALRVSVLRTLSAPERGNVLRWWIAARGLPVPDHRRLREIAGPMLEARVDARPQVQWHGGCLRRHGDRLLAVAPGAPGVAASSLEWDWRARCWLPLGGGRELGLIRDRHGDVDLAALPCPLRVGFRRGGERMRGASGRVALKDVLQSQEIAPWERAEVPLVHAGDRLVAVADLWLDAAYRAASPAQSDRARFRWRRGTPGVSAALD
jgi:tRNA(Ile)-lysidine synthase